MNQSIEFEAMENGRTWESKETRRTQKFGWKINSAESIELSTVNKSSKWILIGATDIPNPHTYSWKVLKRRRKDRRYQQTISNWIHLCTSFPLLFRKEPKRTNENSVRSTDEHFWMSLGIWFSRVSVLEHVQHTPNIISFELLYILWCTDIFINDLVKIQYSGKHFSRSKQDTL